MIDIHSHFLPNIDDGAKNREESFEYLKIMLQLGFTAIVMTPHIYPGYYNNTRDGILKKFDSYKKDLISYFKDKMEFYTGSEVYLNDETIDDLIKGKLLTINDNKRFLLFELDFSFISPNFDEHIKQLQEKGYTLIWAHPERNAKVSENPNLLKRYIDDDVFIQINIGSLVGEFGGAAEHAAKYLLASDMVHFIGSDCHCRSERKSKVPEGLNAFEHIVNPEYKDIILNENPQKAINGDVFYPFPYKNLTRSRLKKILGFFGIGK